MKIKRIKLSDRILPSYTNGEEKFNMITHIVGGGLSILMLFACIIMAAWHRNAAGIITGAIFGISAILLYTMSSLYHGLMSPMTKKVMQVLDHCTIYILIAGTYTPISVCAVVHINPLIGWGTISFCWAVALICVVLNAIDLHRYRVFSMICYVGIGWSTIFFIKTVYEALGNGGTFFLMAGGIAYTIGAVLYGLGKKKKYLHSTFHLFCIAGTVLHFLCIFLYTM